MADNDNFDTIDDDFDVPASRPRNRRNSRHCASRLLPILLIENSVSRADSRRIRSAPSMCLVVQAPSADWVVPLSAAMTELGSWNLNHNRSTIDRSRFAAPDVTGQQVVRLLGGGRRIVGVSQDPQRMLPTPMTAAADMRLNIPYPSDDVIAAVIRRVTGRSPRNLPPGLGARLSFDELVSCIRKNSTARDCVDRLVRAAASKSQVDTLDPATPDLGALHGYGDAMTWCQNLVVDLDAWRRGELAMDAVERHAVIASAPGLGKTTLMRSLARSARVPLVATSVGAWFANSPGNLDSVIKQIDEAFAAARAVAPAILFLDELDAVPSRATISPRGADWWLPVITHLLTTLDGSVSHATVNLIIVGATNHPERLDAALLRPGRLSQVIYIDPPDQVALAGILRQHLGTDLAGADLTESAALALGGTGADVAGWVRSARRIARHAGRSITLADLHAAIAPADNMSSADLARIAVHEAGHAVMAHLLGIGPVVSVSIVRRGLSAGRTTTETTDTAPTRYCVENQVTYDLAGRAAEDVMLGPVSGGAGGGGRSDLANATRRLGAMHLSLGLGDSLLYRADPDDIPRALALDRRTADQVDADLRRLYARAVDLISVNKAMVSAVSEDLMQRRHMDADRFLNVVSRASTRHRSAKGALHG